MSEGFPIYRVVRRTLSEAAFNDEYARRERETKKRIVAYCRPVRRCRPTRGLGKRRPDFVNPNTPPPWRDSRDEPAVIDYVRRRMTERDIWQDMQDVIPDDIEQPKFVFTGKFTATDEGARRKRGRPRNFNRRASPIPLAERDCSLLPNGRLRYYAYRDLLKKYYQKKPSKRTPRTVTDLALRCGALDCREIEGDIPNYDPGLRPRARKEWQKLFAMTEEERVDYWVNKIDTYVNKRGANDRHRRAPGTAPRKPRATPQKV